MALVVLNTPVPLWLSVTAVALPPKVPLIVAGAVPQVVAPLVDNATVGAFAQPQFTFTVAGEDSQPAASRQTTVCEPFATPLKLVPLWNAPPSKAYWIPAPVGAVTVKTALPVPPEQSIVTVGAAACVPLTTHAHVVVLKVAISQQSKPVGIGGCVPLTTQTQVVVLKVAVS